ncbi:MAG: dTDP-4-dehydrorhamnose 3,5-epimerase [Actinomycetota bacterium]
MTFDETPIPGCFVIELERRGDERGFFARVFEDRVFEEHGLVSHFTNVNNSLSATRGTLRGMHYQLAPAAEVKLVRCIRGALYDVALDLATGTWFGVELTADNRRMLYVPEGCAHGFLTLEEDTEALYMTTSYWSPEHERGVRWDDPAYGIEWPLEPVVLSEKDQAWPLAGS